MPPVKRRRRRQVIQKKRRQRRLVIQKTGILLFMTQAMGNLSNLWQSFMILAMRHPRRYVLAGCLSSLIVMTILSAAVEAELDADLKTSSGTTRSNGKMTLGDLEAELIEINANSEKLQHGYNELVEYKLVL